MEERKPKVLAVISGGVLVEIYTDCEVECKFVDFDEDEPEVADYPYHKLPSEYFPDVYESVFEF